jgi:hypothetical protein
MFDHVDDSHHWTNSEQQRAAKRCGVRLSLREHSQLQLYQLLPESPLLTVLFSEHNTADEGTRDERCNSLQSNAASVTSVAATHAAHHSANGTATAQLNATVTSERAAGEHPAQHKDDSMRQSALDGSRPGRRAGFRQHSLDVGHSQFAHARCL